MSQKQARVMSVEELTSLIKEEVGKLGDMKDVEDSKAEEVDADEYADTLEKKIDMQKALKIKEHKALLYLESLRRQQLVVEGSISAMKSGRAGKKFKQARAKMRDQEKADEKAKASNESEIRSMKAAQAQKRLRQARAKSREEERKKSEDKK